MKFFKQASRKENNKQVQRHTAEAEMFTQEQKEIQDAAQRCCAEKARKGACERQQKHQQMIHNNEIANGEQSPGSTKHTQKVSNILN
jgi:hypothetical protein